MKRLLSLSLCLMMALLSFAYNFVSGGIYYNITSYSAPYTVAVTNKGTSYIEYSNEYSAFSFAPLSAFWSTSFKQASALSGLSWTSLSISFSFDKPLFAPHPAATNSKRINTTLLFILTKFAHFFQQKRAADCF